MLGTCTSAWQKRAPYAPPSRQATQGEAPRPPGEPSLPIETRTIEFSGPEVIEALVDFCRANKRPVPSGKIQPLIVVGRKENKVAFEGNGRPSRVHFYE